jgi:hypothetical protein
MKEETDRRLLEATSRPSVGGRKFAWVSGNLFNV